MFEDFERSVNQSVNKLSCHLINLIRGPWGGATPTIMGARARRATLLTALLVPRANAEGAGGECFMVNTALIDSKDHSDPIPTPFFGGSGAPS